MARYICTCLTLLVLDISWDLVEQHQRVLGSGSVNNNVYDLSASTIHRPYLGILLGCNHSLEIRKTKVQLPCWRKEQ